MSNIEKIQTELAYMTGLLSSVNYIIAPGAQVYPDTVENAIADVAVELQYVRDLVKTFEVSQVINFQEAVYRVKLSKLKQELIDKKVILELKLKSF